MADGFQPGIEWIGLFLSQPGRDLPAFALLMGLSGAVNPLYRVGSDAMLADLIPQGNAWMPIRCSA